MISLETALITVELNVEYQQVEVKVINLLECQFSYVRKSHVCFHQFFERNSRKEINLVRVFRVFKPRRSQIHCPFPRTCSCFQVARKKVFDFKNI